MNDDIKKLLENAANEEEFNKIIKDNNIELTDEELEGIAGGEEQIRIIPFGRDSKLYKETTLYKRW